MIHRCQVPVLLIAFNRPDTTIRVMETLEKVRPQKLYVAIDGPRESRPQEAKAVQEVIAIVQNVSWDCETEYLVRPQNVGCKLGVSGAISWVFEHEEKAIIIEDDIIAVPSFFNFAEVLLDRYQTDERIAMISANNYTPLPRPGQDYLLSQYGHIWGWATWKRVWDSFDVAVPEIHEAVKNNFSEIDFASKAAKRHSIRYFKKLAKTLQNKTENTWDSQFTYFRFHNHLLSIVPRVNLASNIGEESSRDDTNHSKPMEHYYESDTKFALAQHPDHLEWDKKYDTHHFENHINKTSFFKKVKIKLTRFVT